MNDILIIYPLDSGEVALLIPSPNWKGTLEELAKKDVPSGRLWKTIERKDIPEDQTFRSCWEYSDSGILINIEKAKAVWKNKWREARKPKLATLDIEFMRAVESGDEAKQASIASQKQALRDVTLTPIDAETPEEIKAVWPEILK